MKQRTKDVILIPCMIALVGGFVFMLWGAWYTGVKWHSPLSTYWLKAVLEAPVPLWFVLIAVISMFIALWKVYTAYRHFSSESSILKKELAELKSNEPNLEKLGPLLYASWSGDSAWGWASSHPEEDPIYVIRGVATLLMDNAKEPAIITRVEIEGAESLGNFDIFRLDPGQPEMRGMRFHFRGKAPRRE